MKNLFTVVAALACASLSAADVVNVSVKALDGFGGDTSAVLTRCQTKAGSVYDPVAVSRDVTALNATGEFQEIRADAVRGADGVEVVFYVKRKMRFQAPLAVKGAEFFSVSKIAKEADLKDGGLYGEGDFATAAARVRAAYHKKHFPDAKVTPVPEMLQSGGNCTLTFLVDEGERLKIRDYVFKGATDEESSELRSLIGDHPWWNPVGWFTDAPASRDQLVQSAAKVREYFADNGYLDAKVAEPERVPCGKELADVIFTVERGRRYRVASTKVVGVTRYSAEAVEAKSRLPEAGAVAGAKDLADAARRVEVAVGSGDSGLSGSHADIRWIPRSEDPGLVDVVFAVKEGVPVVINDVLVEGNDYTKDKVVRREISLGPGDRMLEDRAEQSKRRLENLDYFSRVRYYLKDAGRGRDENGAEYRDLVYEVTEKNTGSFMAGVGASSVDSVYVSAEVSQSNFDLFAPRKLFRGGGQKGRLYAQVGPRLQVYEASVYEPHLFDRLLELTVEGYRRQRWYDDYDIIRNGVAATIAYPVKFWPTWDPFGKFGFRLSGEFIQFDDVEKGEWDYNGRTVSLQEEERRYGDAFEPVVRLFWAHDTRDSFRMPTRGSRTQLFVDLAPAGDNQYYKVGVTHRTYLSPWKGFVRGDSWLRDHVLMVALRAESIDGISDDVPIYNRLFLGGPKSIRGIEYRGVSPYARKMRDGDVTNTWDPWGGQTLFCANLEYTVPIVKMLRIAAFTDIGSVGADEFDLSDDFAWTVGLGLRIDIPMFPIRLDFGTPVEKPDHAKKEVFSFTVGYDF